MGLVGCSGLKPVETLTQPPTATPYPTEVSTPVSTVSQGDALPFETIGRRTAQTTELWEALEPGLVVVATPEDLSQIEGFVLDDDRAQLHKVDFNAYFVVAAFLGWQSHAHEGIDIEQIVRQRNEAAVYVRVGAPNGTLVVTSPYHLVRVRKEGNWNQTIHFTLYMDGTVATSMSHFIP
jgi:hypothetical protein